MATNHSFTIFVPNSALHEKQLHITQALIRAGLTEAAHAHLHELAEEMVVLKLHRIAEEHEVSLCGLFRYDALPGSRNAGMAIRCICETPTDSARFQSALKSEKVGHLS